MFRALMAIAFSTLLCWQALASGRSELKAGYAALMRHDYERAIAYLTRAIEAGDLRRTDLALAYHYRGAEYLKTQRYDEAITDFDKAIELDGKLATAYSDRGIAWRRKGDNARAISDYSEAIRLWPNWHGYYLNRGLAYAAAGRNEEAIADYDKALFYKPDLADAFIARGDAHLQRGRNNEALTDYRRAIHERPDVLMEYPGLAAKLTALGSRP
jgi:tetratricopeptide (TPR) repeat protein